MTARLGAALVSMAMTAAACGSSSPEVTPSPTTSTVTVTSSTEGATSPTTPQLSASFRGVSADSITIAVVSVDYDALRDIFGTDLNYQDPEPVMKPLLDDLNERGGINGRTVEAIYRKFLPVGSTDADRVCLEVTEDVEVFAVFGGFVGPGAQEVNLCLTQLHNTILIGLGGTAAQYAKSTAPWIVGEMDPLRHTKALVALLVEQQLLAERVAIWASNSELHPLVDDVRSELEAAGAVVVFSGVQSAPASDLTASDGEYSLILERALAEEVQAVFWLGNGLSPPKLHAQSAPEIPIYAPFADQIVAAIRDLDGVEALTIYGAGIFPKAFREDPVLARCIEVVEANTDITVQRAEEIANTEPDWYQDIVTNCEQLEIFSLAASAAGADLTNDSFLAAAEQLGAIDLPGEFASSIGPGKYDVSDAIGLAVFDSTAHGKGDFVPVGPLLVFD